MPIEYLTQREAADLLRVSERQISRYRASGKLAFLKLGTGSIRFHRAHVESLLSPAPRPVAGKSWQAVRITPDAQELPSSILRAPSRKAAA
jgi:excisionase family DNA binding protein